MAGIKRKQPFSSFDHFSVESGSGMWPSSDPDDSPFDKFICIHCGASKKIQMYGSIPIGESFDDKAREILRDHLMICKEFNLHGRD